MTRKVAVVVNTGGGAAARAGEKLAGQIEAAFAEAGLSADLHAVEGRDLKATIEKLAARGDVVVGGGDGSLGCAAEAVIGAGATLGILPLGTRNHLARELGIPLDLPGAAKAIAAGATRKIDVATIDGRVFVNNASIGIYPKLVRARDAEQERRGLPKWLANFPAAWATLARLPHHRLRLFLDDAAQPVATPLLFIGSGVYSLDAGSVGTRDALDDGKLSVFAVEAKARRKLIGFALRTLAGRADPQADFAALGVCRRLVVRAHAAWLDVAIDGEVSRLRTPLEFLVKPRALSVFAPADFTPP